MRLFKRFFSCWREQLAFWGAPDAIPFWVQRVVLVVMIIVTVGVRIATIDSPPLDRTQWKEIDYLMISENYWQGGYRFLWPEVSWPAEEPRATAMELPLVPFAAAVGYKIAGQTPLSVRWPTMVAFISLGVFVFLLVRKEFGPIAGISAAAVSLAMPLWHSFGNLLYSDPLAICTGAISIFLLEKWLDTGRRIHGICCSLLLGIALSLKLEMMYLGVCCAWMVWRRYRLKLNQYFPVFGIACCALALPASWYLYAYWIAKNSIDVFGVFGGIYGGHDKFQTLTMLSDPGWYQEMWGRLVWNLLGGKIGLFLFFAGLLTILITRSGKMILAYLVAVLFYFAIVAEGQIDAPYRQIHAVPVFAALVGYGAVGLFALATGVINRFNVSLFKSFRLKSVFAIIFCTVLTVMMSIRKMDEIFNRDVNSPANDHRAYLAEKIREFAGDEALIVTIGEYSIHKGGVDLSPVLYRYANSRGWSLTGTDWTVDDINSFRAKGAKLIVGVELNREQSLKDKVEKLIGLYRVMLLEKDSIILNLKDFTSKR